MIEPTGYWTFFCNPKKWHIDKFLSSSTVIDNFSISKHHKDYFNKGQLGVVRVGYDKRTKAELQNRPRLKRGVYAIVEILDVPKLMKSTKKEYGEDEKEDEEDRLRVSIRCLKNLLHNPVLLEQLNLSAEVSDKHLVKGQQGSTMPLNPSAFENLLSKVGGLDTLEFDFQEGNQTSLKLLEEKYADAVPLVKQRVSKYIERGSIAQEFKRKTNFKCQICDSLGLNPYSFKKPDGEYYIETHHVIPVSTLQAGLLSSYNLITVCANHHRQLHYGKVKLIENTAEIFVFEIDDNIVQIPKGQ
ncbi:HNH endonuclease [Alteribacter natronophilus]|uniref:HNH endonuclease n=1 Tax=Alteribacter natronophilus TaxID=2583810 RepID=UPI00110EC9F6|nr:EVE domain-containing protein [Alteribacter natronophilus]TMW71208.1 EVE domain-containing protein [Alteribacter natronophilus]